MKEKKPLTFRYLLVHFCIAFLIFFTGAILGAAFLEFIDFENIVNSKNINNGAYFVVFVISGLVAARYALKKGIMTLKDFEAWT